MARDPDHRYGSAREMTDALADGVDLDPTLPVASPDVTDTVPVELPETVAVPRPPRAPAPERPPTPRRSRRARRVVGAIVGALLALVVIVGLTRGNDEPPRSPSSTTQPTTASLPQQLEQAVQQLEQAVGG